MEKPLKLSSNDQNFNVKKKSFYHLQPTFAAPFQSNTHLESSQTSGVGLLAEIVHVFRPLVIFAKELRRGCLTRLYMRLCLMTYYSLQKF